MAAKNNYNQYFFILALIAVSILTFFIFKPFFSAILAAAILAMIFQKPYKFFLRLAKNKKGLSSVLTALLVVSIVVVPLFGVAGLLIDEVGKVVKKISADGSQYQKYADNAENYLKNIPLFQNLEIKDMFGRKEISNSLKDAGQGILSVLQKTYQSLAGAVIWIFVMFFSLYYFLMDGEKIVKNIIRLSPLDDEHEKMLVEKFISISRATLKGTIVVGAIQGLVGGIIFVLVGISSPIVWGTMMVLLSIIPMVGSGFVWFPAGIIMLMAGNIWQGVVILAAGILIISTIDNLLRPKLVGRDTQMHPLLVFFSTLGGIIVFGLSGFILGPIIMAFFLTLWEIYAAAKNA